jgi:hypothetical protein
LMFRKVYRLQARFSYRSMYQKPCSENIQKRLACCRLNFSWNLLTKNGISCPHSNGTSFWNIPNWHAFFT